MTGQSYAKDVQVTHGGKTWISMVDNNTWEPGAAGEAPTPVESWIDEANETLDALKAVAFSINSDGELEVNV